MGHARILLLTLSPLLGPLGCSRPPAGVVAAPSPAARTSAPVVVATMPDAAAPSLPLLDATSTAEPVIARGPPVAKLVASGRRTCAILVDRTVRCWGGASKGAAGGRPFVFEGLTRVAELSLGTDHGCARTEGGGVACWGGLQASRDDEDDEPWTRATRPTILAKFSGVARVAVSMDCSACVLFTDGSAKCWGDDNGGVLGYGAQSRQYAPIALAEVKRATDISLGHTHGCARIADGTVKCWGERFAALGQEGEMLLHGAPVRPTAVPGVRDVAQVVTGSTHTCVRRTDGAVLCWGYNQHGEIGDGTRTNREKATQVPGLAHVAGLSTYGHLTCARTDEGAAWCWGESPMAPVLRDDASDGTDVLSPKRVPDLEGVVDVAVGSNHGCALLRDASVKCWGNDDSGQLGDGAKESRPTPAPVRW